MRTTISAKNDRIRLEREFQIGDERWQLVQRLSFPSLEQAIEKWPKLWRPETVELAEIGEK